jgi:hypothetical protein
VHLLMAGPGWVEGARGAGRCGSEPVPWGSQLNTMHVPIWCTGIGVFWVAQESSHAAPSGAQESSRAAQLGGAGSVARCHAKPCHPQRGFYLLFAVPSRCLRARSAGAGFTAPRCNGRELHIASLRPEGNVLPHTPLLHLTWLPPQP